MFRSQQLGIEEKLGDVTEAETATETESKYYSTFCIRKQNGSKSSMCGTCPSFESRNKAQELVQKENT